MDPLREGCADDFQPQPLTLTKVACPELGIFVHVKLMSGQERDAFDTDCQTAGREVNLRARLAAATLCDAKGKLLFTFDQVAELGRTSGVVLDRIAAAAVKLNKLSEKDIADLEKN